MKNLLRKILPWIAAAVILAWLFNKTSPSQIAQALNGANIPLFILFALAYFATVLLLDCIGIKWVISRFSTPVTFKETVGMRGATYLLMVLNYNLAQGGMAFYLKRTHHAPVFKTLGAIAFLTLCDLALTVTFAFLAVLFHNPVLHGIFLRPWVIKTSLFFYGFLALWIAFWKMIDAPWGFWMKKLKVLDWLTSRTIFFAFREARLKDYAVGFSLAFLMIGFIIPSVYLVFGAFGCSLPATAVYLYTPLVMIVGTLPITPAGIGTVQAASLEFFKDQITGSPLQAGFSAEQIILASTLLWTFGNLCCKIGFGFLCLRKQSRKLFEEIK